ncbi:hypothetical protein [Acetobacter estunensis]|nr:hypothetical protein [Acetobacter estunensis]
MPVTYGVASPAPYFIPPSSSGGANLSSSTAHAGMALPSGTKLTSPEKDYYVTAPALSLKPQEKDGIRHIGPFNIEQSNSSPVPMETGRTITAAYPVKGVPGMDLTINMFAGHRETNTGSNVGTAALTAGMRIKW